MQRQQVKPLEPIDRKTRCSVVDRLIVVAFPTMAFGYSERLDPDRLRQALARVLVDFGSFAGRLVRNADDWYIDHGSSVAFETAEHAGPIAALAAALRTKHSGVVCPRLSVRATLRGREPLFAARLTQARDGCVLGITWNHALGDTQSVMLLLRAWSLAYREQPYTKPAEITDRAAYLDEKVPVPLRHDMRARVLSWPQFLRALSYQLWAIRHAKRVAIDFSWDQISAIHAAATRDKPVSPSDALCAQLFCTLDELGAGMSPDITVAVDFRKGFGVPPNALGNFSDLVFTTVDLGDGPAEVASALRSNVDAFGAGALAGTMSHRHLQQLRASHPGALDMLRFWFFGEPGRGNLRLSNISRLPYNKLVFVTTEPAFVHARATDVPLVGTGIIFPSPGATGLTLDIVLPAKVVERLADDSSWAQPAPNPQPSPGHVRQEASAQ